MSLFCRAVKKTQTLTSSGGRRKGNASHFFVFLCFNGVLYRVKPVSGWRGDNGGLGIVKTGETWKKKGEIGRIVGQSHSGTSHLSSRATHRYSMHFEAYICVYRSLLVMLVMNFEKLVSRVARLAGFPPNVAVFCHLWREKIGPGGLAVFVAVFYPAGRFFWRVLSFVQ